MQHVCHSIGVATKAEQIRGFYKEVENENYTLVREKEELVAKMKFVEESLEREKAEVREQCIAEFATEKVKMEKQLRTTIVGECYWKDKAEKAKQEEEDKLRVLNAKFKEVVDELEARVEGLGRTVEDTEKASALEKGRLDATILELHTKLNAIEAELGSRPTAEEVIRIYKASREQKQLIGEVVGSILPHALASAREYLAEDINRDAAEFPIFFNERRK